MNPEFKETQKFTQWWLWLMIIAFMIFPAIMIFEKVFIEGKPLKDNSLIVFLGAMLGLIILFSLIRLHTEIDQTEIRFKLFPFTKQRYSWADVKHAEVFNYGFIGGWGIRLWTKYGTAYNIKGNQGLAIELKNGKKILIGTQKADELKQFIEAIRS